MSMKLKRPSKVTSLWKVVEAMQRKLEGEGLDAATVDKAVTHGLAELLHDAPAPAPQKLNGRRPKLAIAKA